MRIHHLLWTVVAVLLVSRPIDTLAQARPGQPPIPSLGETMEISIVNLDVFVTDRQGRRVRGLTKNDFEILEGGSPRAISNFAEYSSAGRTEGVVASTPEEEAVPLQKRTVVLFFEAVKISPSRSGPFLAQLKNTIRSIIRKGDSLTLVLWSGKAQLKADFTDDHQRIERAIDQVGAAMTGVHADNSLRMRQEVAGTIEFERELVAMYASRGETSKVLDPERAGEAAAEIQAAVQLGEIKKKVSAINATINSIAGADGKKIVLLATHRLGEIAGGEFFYLAGTQNATQYMRLKFGTEGMIKSIVNNANASGVTIYPIYAAGTVDATVGASSDLAADPGAEQRVVMNETLSLQQIAERTGGMMAFGAADIVKLLPRIEEDVSDYYSLAYRVDSSGKDRSRDVQVRPKDRNLTVRSRRQFVEKSEQTRMSDRVTAILFQSFERPMFALTVDAGAPLKRGRNLVLPMKIRIPIKDLTLLPRAGRHAGAFTVYVVSAASMGQVSEIDRQTQSFEVPARDLERAVAGYFTYNYQLIINKSIDRVAIGVLDEVSKNYALHRVELTRDPAAGGR